VSEQADEQIGHFHLDFRLLMGLKMKRNGGDL